MHALSAAINYKDAELRAGSPQRPQLQRTRIMMMTNVRDSFFLAPGEMSFMC